MKPPESTSNSSVVEKATVAWWHRRALRTKTIKRWKRSELVTDNLDFSFASDYPLHELIGVWLWELDRELGTVKTPFVAQARQRQLAEKQFGAEEINCDVVLPPGVRYQPLKQLLPRIKPDTDWVRNRRAAYSTIHAFEIDWTLEIPRIVDAFRIWLEGQSVHRHYGAKRGRSKEFGPPVYFPTKGRKDFIHAWLMELAIYRIDSADLKYKPGVALLDELGIRRRMSIQLDSSNWSHAKTRTKARILIYKREVEIIPGYKDTVTQDMPLAWELLKSFSRRNIDKSRRSSR